jgi:hypothetical protein
MKYIKEFKINEGSDPVNKVTLLTTYDLGDTLKTISNNIEKYYDEMTANMKKSIDDLYGSVGAFAHDDDDGTMEETWGYDSESIWNALVQKPNFDKSKKDVKDNIIMNLPKDISKMKSDIIDIDTFMSLEDELTSIKDGDEVLMLTKHTNYDKSPPGKMGAPCIIKFKALGINQNSTTGWIGVAANDSFCPEINRGWGMISIDWGEKIITVDTYNSFADKRI